jgi:hypothetical protein
MTPPLVNGGMPLMQALKLGRSAREYADRPLPPQVLSDLLWSAFGIYRRETGDRSAPLRHVMVIDVYAAMADGAWFYKPTRHALKQHLNADIRAETGFQDFGAAAPLNLIYVAHGERMQEVSAEERRLCASVDAVSLGKMYICSVPRKDSRPCSALRSTKKACSEVGIEWWPVRHVRANGRIPHNVSLCAAVDRTGINVGAIVVRNVYAGLCSAWGSTEPLKPKAAGPARAFSPRMVPQ